MNSQSLLAMAIAFGTVATPGVAWAASFRDSAGSYFDGGRTYKMTLPGPIPVNKFWAFTVYDNQTRSLLSTDQRSAGLDSNRPQLQKSPDGGATVWFGPQPPTGHEGELGANDAGLGLFSPFYSFTVRWNPGLTRPGSRATSN